MRTGRGRRFGVVVSDFNGDITEKLLKSCLKTWEENGTRPESVTVVHVPGSFELPLMAQEMARTKKYDAVAALGCIIRGQTPHDRYLSQEVARGLGQAALNTGVPVIFGVLTTLNVKQALARAGKGSSDKGREAALAALQMANISRL